MASDTAPASELQQETILGLDNIALDLPIAGLGSRVLAAAIDYTILTVMVVVTLVVAFGLLVAAEIGGGWTAAILFILYFLLNWGYFMGLEAATRGRTFGKMAVGLRVVGREGGAASLASLVVRNILRDVDLLVGIPLMAFDPLARRLGDRLAGSLVVHDRAAEGDPVLGRLPPGWGVREVAVVESYLKRAREMQPDQALYLARRLLKLVERDAPEFLTGVDVADDPQGALRQALAVKEG